MMWKLITLLPCAATVLTLAIIPKAQAAVIIPTPTVTTFNTDGVNFNPSLTGNQAIIVEDIVVETTQGVESTIYRACFEYGTYTGVFNTNRTDAPCVNTASISSAEFLGQELQAERAAGAESPANTTMPTSDGLLTALSNALANNNVDQTQGFLYDGNGNILDADPLTPGTQPVAIGEYLIPYDLTGSTVTSYKGSYNTGTDQWQLDGINSADVNGVSMFVRFEETGTIDLDPQPPQPGVPEPSGLMGIFLAGVSMLATVRRR